MKRLFLLFLILLVAPVCGLSLDFQDASQSTQYQTIIYLSYPTAHYNGDVTWIHDTNGGNSYIKTRILIDTDQLAGYYIANTIPEASTYAACTLLSYTAAGNNRYPSIALFDSAKNAMYVYNYKGSLANKRVEVKVTGGQAYVYSNGILLETSGALAQNPSYIGFGTAGVIWAGTNDAEYALWDDYVYGVAENKYIYDMPERDAYVIMKDMINSAASGIYTSSGSIVDANYMYTRFGRGNAAIPPDALTNESINLVQWGGVIPYATLYTSTDYSGARTFNIHEALINSTAPYGYYAITIPGTALYSDPILYEAGGASVSWDKDIYSVGDTGVIVTYVADGGYWDPAVYDYQVVAQDIFGNVIESQTVNTQSGSMSVTFTDADNLGVYYAILKAKLKSSPTYDIWMSVDAAELQAYIVFNGYVMNAESGALLSGATVNVTQGTATKKSISGSYGWNSTNNWLSGSQFNITTNLTGYTSDVRLFTPLTSKSIALNISLIPSPATTVGLSVGGVVRDNVYGNPVTSATYWVQNGTAYSSTTNIAGFARVDNLPEAKWYNVWSSKTGFGNSSVVPVLAGAS